MYIFHIFLASPAARYSSVPHEASPLRGTPGTQSPLRGMGSIEPPSTPQMPIRPQLLGMSFQKGWGRHTVWCGCVYISPVFFGVVVCIYIYIKRHSVSNFFWGCILKVVVFPKDSHWSFRWFMSCTRTCFYLYLVAFCRGVVKADKDWLKSHQQINCTQICPPQVSLFSTTSSITCHYATYDASNAYQRGDRVTWTFTIPSLYDGSIHRASLPTDGHQPGTSNSGVYLATLRCERNRAGSAGYIDGWAIKYKSQERYDKIGNTQIRSICLRSN